jgi:hypothetical protein
MIYDHEYLSKRLEKSSAEVGDPSLGVDMRCAVELIRELDRRVNTPAPDYWQRRCVKAEELLIQVSCDPKWTDTVSAHFDKIRDGDKATLNACHMQYANSK